MNKCRGILNPLLIAHSSDIKRSIAQWKLKDIEHFLSHCLFIQCFPVYRFLRLVPSKKIYFKRTDISNFSSPCWLWTDSRETVLTDLVNKVQCLLNPNGKIWELSLREDETWTEKARQKRTEQKENQSHTKVLQFKTLISCSHRAGELIRLSICGANLSVRFYCRFQVISTKRPRYLQKAPIAALTVTIAAMSVLTFKTGQPSRQKRQKELRS